jgi:hypothetical protein
MVPGTIQFIQVPVAQLHRPAAMTFENSASTWLQFLAFPLRYQALPAGYQQFVAPDLLVYGDIEYKSLARLGYHNLLFTLFSLPLAQRHNFPQLLCYLLTLLHGSSSTTLFRQ